MFEIMEYPDRDSAGQKFELVDRERGLRLSWVRGSRGKQLFTLAWGDRLIPFTVERRDNLGPQPEEWVVDPRRWHIIQFGPIDWTTFPYQVDKAYVRRRALELAAEAIVVLGVNFDGPSWPDGYFTASYEFEGELFCYRLSDYGYPSGLGQAPRIKATR